MHFKVLSCVAATTAAMLAIPAMAQTQPGWFPFVIPWDDAAKTAVDVSYLNPAPIDESRRVSARDGHFYDATGRRVRFLGTGLSFSANFPDKADADKLAARMHKYGINIVRLHHMDSGVAPRAIFDAKAPGKSKFDADQLDRLDYLISQFKKNGIYVDLNLHVTRKLEAGDGLQDTEKLPGQGKVLAYYEPHLMEIQRKYAHDLLTHLNPYTGLKYADDPTFAIIELNNEDSLVGAAWSDVLNKLPETYKAPLRQGWNDFLKQKYGSTTKLNASWSQPLGTEVLRTANADAANPDWVLETQGGAKAILAWQDKNDAGVDPAIRQAAQQRAEKATAGTPLPNGQLPTGRQLRLKVNAAPAEAWRLALFQAGIDLQPGKQYTLNFSARAAETVPLGVATKLDQAPWAFFGVRQDVRLGTEWRRYSLPFSSEGAVPGHTRLAFTIGYLPTDLWLADVSVQEGTPNQNGPAVKLANAQFADTSGWTLDAPAGVVNMTAEDAGTHAPAPLAAPETGGPQGKVLHVGVSQATREAWYVQVNQLGVPLKAEQPYTLQFWARSSSPRNISVNAKLNKAPWRAVGLNQSVALTSSWQRYTVSFVPDQPDAEQNRLSFIVGQGFGDVWLADISLRPGVQFNLPAGQTLEQGNVDLLTGGRSPSSVDYVTYLMNLERDYVTGMTRYLRQDLGAKSMISCSQANFGGLAGVAREALTDFVDTHAYWEHPRFPHQQWDARDWIIKNSSMVRNPDGGTLPRLAMHRVEGKPFTVTEYNHPAPSDFQAETVPMVAAYAASQDWDGFFLFDYNADRKEYHNESMKGFFDTDTNPAKMAFLPAAARIFLDSPPIVSSSRLTLRVPRQQLNDLTARFNSAAQMWDPLGYRGLPNQWEANGSGAPALLTAKGSIQLTDGGTSTLNTTTVAPAGADQGGLKWSPADGLFQYASPQAEVFAGFPTKTVDIGVLSLTPPAANPGFLSLTLHSRDGKPVRQSKSLLLTIAGKVENTGMEWNKDRTSVADKWGTAPTVAEGIVSDIAVELPAGNWTVYALDGTGARAGTVPSEFKAGRLSFHTGPEFKTLWYEISAG